MNKIKIVAFFSLLLSTTYCHCQDINLYNSNGEAEAYISVSNNYTIFSWKGQPLAYLTNGNNNSVNIYSFQGEHLGWFDDGVIRDHQGKISLFKKESLSNILYKIETLKGLQQLVPLKKFEKLEPLKPIYQNYFSNNLFFLGTENQNSSSTIPDIYKKNQTNQLDNYKRYEPDYNGRMNAINAKTEEYNEMIARGYIYDSKSGNYYTKEQMLAIEKNKNNNTAAYNDMVREANNTNSYSFTVKKSKKNTLYTAYIGNEQLGVYDAKVLIMKNGKISGFYFTHPKYGYMFFGASKKPKVKFPSTEVSFVGDISKLRRNEVGALGYSFVNGQVTIFFHKGLIETSE